MAAEDDTRMTRRFSLPQPIRDERPKNQNTAAYCPACGGAFADACRHCGLTRLGDAAAAQLPFPTRELPELTFPLSSLEAAADPYELMTSWRHALPAGGLLRLTPPAGTPAAAWRIPKRALMLLAERAGFRLVGRGWLRKIWLFRRY